MEKKLSVIIPVKNNIKLTQDCIDSLRKNTPMLGEIIIIDDHSIDEISSIEGVRHYMNRGTGIYTAWNYGGELAKYPYIAFINNDILFSKDWEKPLIEALNEDVWVASPWHTAGDLPADFPIGVTRKTNMMGNETGLPFIGSCFIMEKKNWDKVQPIDERFKLWSGDNYLYESVTQDFKKKTVEVKDSYVHHFGGRTMMIPSSNPIFEEDLRVFDEVFKSKGWQIK